MHTRLAILLLSTSLLFSTPLPSTPVDDLSQLPRHELMAIIHAQNSFAAQRERYYKREKFLVGVKGITFGAVMTYTGLWFFKIKPTFSLKNLF